MRRHLALTLGLLAGVALGAAPAVRAGEKKDNGKPLLKINDELTEDDAKETFPHPLVKGNYRKVHKFKMGAGKAYRIDVVSKDFDALVRVEDAKGNHLAADDDTGGDWNARLHFVAPAEGEYRLIVTQVKNPQVPGNTGKYTLTVIEAKGDDLTLARARSINALPAKDRKEALEEYKKWLKDKGAKLTVADLQMSAEVAQKLGAVAPADAVAACGDFAQLLSKSSDEKVAEASKQFQKLGQAIEQMAKGKEKMDQRNKLVGKELEVKGPTLDGKDLDWKSYRGKVVLVDFWATWCKPCMDELPNIKKMYELYHDRGFEVVGISLDYKRDALDKFMEKDKLPWKCIYDLEGGKSAMATLYQVEAIPFAILVDKEGRVLSVNARGPELQRLLEKQLGPPKEKEKEKEK
jgi:thiol-disulfide isomerase/thioredoxin